MRRTFGRVGLLAAGCSLALPAIATAHGLVGRRDLPLPTWLFAWAACTVLVVSFVGLGAMWRSARLAQAPERQILKVPAWLEIPFALLGVATLVLVVVSGLFGVQIDTANFAPTAIFVGLWIAVPFASLLLGDLYAAINPLRALGRGTGWLLSRVAGDRVPAPLELPERIGHWPAAGLLLAFAWVELAFPGRGDPSQIAVLVLLFVVVQSVGMSLYGTDRWLGCADPFAVWFGWVATLSPLRWSRGTLYLRAPGVGAAQRPAIAGDAAVVIIAIGTTAWDGFSGGSLPGTSLADLANDVATSGLSVSWSNALVQTAGMLVMVALVAALVLAGVRQTPAPRPARDAPPLTGRAATSARLRRYTPSLVPIAVAYAVGHYVSLLAFQGQSIAPLLANPLGHELAPGDGGWLGTAGWTINYTWLTAAGIWYLQTGALLLGHLLALVLSHDRALERSSRRQASRSQRAMLVVAVVFTCNGLWLLSAV